MTKCSRMSLCRQLAVAVGAIAVTVALAAEAQYRPDGGDHGRPPAHGGYHGGQGNYHGGGGSYHGGGGSGGLLVGALLGAVAGAAVVGAMQPPPAVVYSSPPPPPPPGAVYYPNNYYPNGEPPGY